jgi:hypothetical protein
MCARCTFWGLIEPRKKWQAPKQNFVVVSAGVVISANVVIGWFVIKWKNQSKSLWCCRTGGFYFFRLGGVMSHATTLDGVTHALQPQPYEWCTKNSVVAPGSPKSCGQIGIYRQNADRAICRGISGFTASEKRRYRRPVLSWIVGGVNLGGRPKKDRHHCRLLSLIQFSVSFARAHGWPTFLNDGKAQRIRARAIRRAGELLAQIEPVGGARDGEAVDRPAVSRTDAARDVGFSAHQHQVFTAAPYLNLWGCMLASVSANIQ